MTAIDYTLLDRLLSTPANDPVATEAAAEQLRNRTHLLTLAASYVDAVKRLNTALDQADVSLPVGIRSFLDEVQR